MTAPQLPMTVRFMLALLAVLAGPVTGCRWNSTGQNTLGVREYNQGRYAEALQQFQAAQASDPTNPDAYYNLAATYHKLGIAQKDAKVIEQSESLYNQCLDLDPNHVDCHRGLAVLLVESGRSDSGVLLLSNWATQNPTSSDARVELARLYKELGKIELAEQYLDEAIALNTSDPRAWKARGQLREAEGEIGQAIQNYQHSLALNSLQTDVAMHVAELNFKLAQNALTGQSQNAWTAQNPQPGGQIRY